MSVTVEGQVGPRMVSDGGNTELRQTRYGGLVTQDAHGRYWEAASRGFVFSVNTALTGTTVAAGNVSPVAAAAATILTLWNPPGSGVYASILKGVVSSISGTPGAGPLAWNLSPSFGPVTAATNATPVSSLGVTATSKMKCFTQTAITGSLAHVLYRGMPLSNFAAALAASAGPLSALDEAAGEIVIPPGGACSIAAPAAGTTWIVSASITWEEMPALTPNG